MGLLLIGDRIKDTPILYIMSNGVTKSQAETNSWIHLSGLSNVDKFNVRYVTYDDQDIEKLVNEYDYLMIDGPVDRTVYSKEWSTLIDLLKKSKGGKAIMSIVGSSEIRTILKAYETDLNYLSDKGTKFYFRAKLMFAFVSLDDKDFIMC